MGVTGEYPTPKNNKYCTLWTTPPAIQEWFTPKWELHRVDENGIQDGPAVIWKDGTQFWYLNDKCHRLDGAAQIYPDGTQFWWLDGEELTQEEWAADPRVIELHSRTQEGAEEWLKRL